MSAHHTARDAEYHRLTLGPTTVTIRVSTRFGVPPVCMTCRRNDCDHVQAYARVAA